MPSNFSMCPPETVIPLAALRAKTESALTTRPERLRLLSVPHKQTARSGVTPKRAVCFLPKERLVSHLRHDVTGFVDFAIRTLWHKSGVGASAEPQRSRWHHPRFHEHIG